MLREVKQANARVGEDAIHSFEVRYEVKLPRAYREFLLATNGGRPIPPVFPIQRFPNNPIGVIQVFFGFNANIRAHDLAIVMGELAGVIPVGLLPIACTDGDDFVCIDLRKAGAPVLFWDRRPFWGTNAWNDTDLYPVTDNFEALLRALSDYFEQGATGWPPGL